jgi:hypothetical protein
MKPASVVGSEFRKLEVNHRPFLIIFYRTAVTMGRGIRRLVSLFESLETIVTEADNRLQAEVDGQERPPPTTDEETEAHEASVVCPVEFRVKLSKLTG